MQHLLRGTPTTRHIKIIITSRPHIPVASHLPDVRNLSVVAENLHSDIKAYVKTEVCKLPQFSGKLGDEVQQALIDGANGMFLWVSLILDDLKKSTKPRAIRKALKKLPSDLPGVYMKILRQIRTDAQTTAQSILQWVVWAIRPLTLQELTIAIAIEPEHTSMSSMQDDMHIDLRQDLRLIFGPILRIEDDNTIHLIHQSAKDFLIGTNISTEGGLSLLASVTSSENSNAQLAVSCLTYLSFDECEDGPVSGESIWAKNVRQNIDIRRRKLPFLDYAATHWPEHARQADESDKHDVLCQTFLKLAHCRQKINLAYQIFAFSQHERFQETAPLQIASSLGLTTFAKELLNHGADINDQGGQYGNALQAAAVKSHVSMVCLLSALSDVQITGDIVTAAAGNSSGKRVMEVLLSARPDIQITEPIVTAAAGNSSGKGAMEVLLSARPNIQITEPIVTAAAGNWKSGKQLMEVLLSARPDIQITEPIVIAAAGNSSGKEVMEVLLSARPDIQITEPIVTAAAGNEESGKEVMRLLIESDRKFRIHSAAVNAAAYFGMLEHTKSLLTKCNKTSLNDKYTQLVHAAVESGVADILSIILELGVNYSSPDKHNWTIYMTASQSRNEFALQQFVDMAHPLSSSVLPPARWAIEHAHASIQLQGDGAELQYSGKGRA